MAIKELFYDNRPQVLLDPRASQRIDPRFKFTRNGTATYIDREGVIRTANTGEPRFSYDFDTKEYRGFLIEPSKTNQIRYSALQQVPSTTDAILVGSAAAPDGSTDAKRYRKDSSASNSINITIAPPTLGTVDVNTPYTFSVFLRSVSGSFDVTLVAGQPSSTAVAAVTTTWRRYYITGTTDIADVFRCYVELLVDGSQVDVWGAQLEVGSSLTSYIPTNGAFETRAADLLSIEAPLPASGSVYIDARAISANENDTLLSLKNDSNDKIDLAYLSNTATYNSLALIANYDGTSKSSLPLPVPTTDRERNIITYGTNNYQYGRDSSRFAPSLSSSVPTGLNKLSIGHDAVDPTKAFNGYINTVYAWSGELTPEVAEALVRGEIDAIDADTYSPTGPAGSLALVINTQGAAADGEKTFTLPAESVANDNDIVITWGDGTESGLDGAAAELGAVGLTHDYPAAGIYPVWVEGEMENIKYNNISNAGDLLLIAAWGTGDMLTSPSTMNGAFYGCSQMDFSSSARTTNRPDTSAVTDWTSAFQGCSSITGTFPSFDFTAATNFTSTWNGCSSLASVPAIFVADGSVTQNVTTFNSAWKDCSSLASFPAIDTSSGTSFSQTWAGCISLTSFPLIDTSSGTNLFQAWFNCSGLTSFPLIDTGSGTNFGGTWRGCGGLTSFPLIDTSSGTAFSQTWFNCSGLTSFPLIDTSSGTSFGAAWRGCGGLTSFPLIDTSSGTNFADTWQGCSGLTSFPLIDTSSGTSFIRTWQGCSGLTSFPLIDTGNATNFGEAWGNCSGLTSFPAIDTSSGTSFSRTWLNCVGLTSFPAGFFDSWSGTPSDECFYLTWDGCSSLTATSVDNILVSIAASGVSAPSGTDTNDKKITIDYDGTTLPGTTATAITTLKSRNWGIYLNDVLQ